MVNEGCVDLMYLAWNRLEFTRETFTTLLGNTDWRYVHELFVYDDGSQDGTREWLESSIDKVPVPARFVKTNFGSPVAAMVHFIESATAPILAKTDNDAMLPPAWLRLSLEVLDRHPELSLLGIEAMYPHQDDVQLARSYTPAQFVSGLGLYRRAAFAHSRPRPIEQWFGFEHWQSSETTDLVKGWITPAIPAFLLDRLPFDPWKTYTAGYVRGGWQREWPRYRVGSTLWRWRWPDQCPAGSILTDGDSRFLCAMRVRNEGKHIGEVLLRVLHLCQRVFVFDDHSTDETVAVCKTFGDRVSVFESQFQGLDEARDKNFLLKRVIEANPQWVLWIDGDEILELAGAQKLKAAAENARNVSAYSLRIAYVWNDPNYVRVDGIFGQFRRLSFFRLRGQSSGRLYFPTTGSGGNLHCGNVPRGLIGASGDLEVRLKHLGYVTREQRRAKYEWYSNTDPNNAAEDCYRHLAEIPGARFAPGAPQLVPWVE